LVSWWLAFIANIANLCWVSRSALEPERP
jgi:hypothetical protein